MKKRKRDKGELKGFRHLYIHVPFCRRKCGYCAFYSEVSPSPERIAAWLSKVRSELEAAALKKEIASVYLGGGTPTLLEAAELSLLGRILRDNLTLTPETEITIEANPETLDRAKAEELAGWVNRLSVGVQSFDAARRAALGRDCSDQAIDTALRLGEEFFKRLSLDLIYGVGSQSLEEWRGELARAVSYRIEHLSCYELTPEEQARLELTAPEEELAIELWKGTREFLEPHGFKRYEISNYARPGGKSRHNRAVWRGEAYLGIGPAATSFDGRKRWTQVEDLSAWLAGAPPEVDEVTPEVREAEIFAVKLRTARGWSQRQCENKFSRALLEKVEVLRKSCPEWFDPGPGVRLNEQGMLFWNSIAEYLI